MMNKSNPVRGSPSVLIVIVNYRTATLVENCLRSLEPEVRAHAGAEVVVVDNSSNDGSVEHISEAIQRRSWSDWATLLPSQHNGGFSYGNNFAIRPRLDSAQPPDYYWLLNPDTEVRPGALDALVAFLEAHPEVGIAGSSLEDETGLLWPIAFRFPSILSELDSGLRLGLVTRLLADHVVVRKMSGHAERVDWLPGASMMIRRQVFERIGLMDEGYFLYFEETDFCLQARRAQLDCWYVPASRVMHIAGQSTGVTSKSDVKKRLPAYWYESRRRYFVKNHGRVYAGIADVAWLLSFCLWRVRRALQGHPDRDPPKIIGDFIRHSSICNRGETNRH